MVQRFDLVSGYMQEWSEGEWVTYEDYAALLAEAKELKARIKQHSESVHFCEVCGKDDPCETDDVCWPMPETPITDGAEDD